MKTNLYLIAGDPFLRSQKANAIAADLEKKAGGPLSHQSFRLSETSLETVLLNARMLPFLAQGQVFHVRDADRMKAEDLGTLEKYLAGPSDATCLIFEVDSLEGKTGLRDLIKSNGQVVLLDKTEGRSAAQTFLQQKLSRAGKTMPPPARSRLLEMCGEAVVFLDTMLDRLVQYAGEKSEISEDMVAEFEEKWTEVSVFQLTDALLARDRGRAVRVFKELVEGHGADPVSLIGILHWQLRMLWHGASLLEEGVPESAMLARVKVPPYRQRSFMAAVRVLGTEKLERAIEALYQLDRKSKTGLAEGLSGLESWLVEYV